MVYLESALAGKLSSTPSGMFYWTIADPSGESDLENLSGKVKAEEITEFFASKYDMNGLRVTDDPKAKAPKGSMCMTNEEFDEFRESVREGLKKVCENIQSGSINIAPQRSPITGKKPCEYCDYKSICIRE